MTTALETRILVVDDDPQMRTYIRRCLAPISSDVMEAADGAEALKLLQAAGQHPVGLVIADVVMPEMDGHALRNAIRGSEALRETPVLLVTGEAGPRQPGQGPVLAKPFNGRLLRTYVRSLLTADPGAVSDR